MLIATSAARVVAASAAQQAIAASGPTFKYAFMFCLAGGMVSQLASDIDSPCVADVSSALSIPESGAHMIGDHVRSAVSNKEIARKFFEEFDRHNFDG